MARKTSKQKHVNPHLGEDVMEYFRRKEEADPAFAAMVEDGQLRYDLAHRVRGLREGLGLSQAEVAERIGTKQPAIARIEHAVSMPKIEMLQKLARVFGMRVQVEFVPAPKKRRRRAKAASPRTSAAAETRPSARASARASAR